MPGKLNERSALYMPITPASRTTTGTLYNTAGTTGSGIDTRGADEIVFDISVGAVTAGTTLDISVVAGETDDASLASAVSGASFTQITNSNQNTARTGSVNSMKNPGYMWAKVEKGGTADAAIYGVTARTFKLDAAPQTTNTYDFRV